MRTGAEHRARATVEAVGPTRYFDELSARERIDVLVRLKRLTGNRDPAEYARGGTYGRTTESGTLVVDTAMVFDEKYRGTTITAVLPPDGTSVHRMHLFISGTVCGPTTGLVAGQTNHEDTRLCLDTAVASEVVAVLTGRRDDPEAVVSVRRTEASTKLKHVLLADPVGTRCYVRIDRGKG